MRSEIYLILCDKTDFSYFKNNSSFLDFLGEVETVL